MTDKILIIYCYIVKNLKNKNIDFIIVKFMNMFYMYIIKWIGIDFFVRSAYEVILLTKFVTKSN